MNVFEAVSTTPAALVDLDPYRFPTVYDDDRYEEEPATQDITAGLGDPRAAVTPVSDLAVRLAPADRRRLELHAALTAAGIAPLPGDLDAVEALCTLDDTTHQVLRRWLNRFDSL